MNDEQLLRYSRQILLPHVDVAGQQKLNSARVLIIGMGGLGSPVATYLAAAGVGELVLVDFDTVDLSNLQRQIIHATSNVGEPKVDSARARIADINPEVKVETISTKLAGEALTLEVEKANIVVDCTDNFEARFELNRACVRAGTPLVSGAAIRFEGQVTVFNNDGNSPCYRCLYRDEGEEELRCSENGILAPVVGVIGTLQATEVLKTIMGIGETLNGRLMIFDGLMMEWRTMKLRRDPDCPVCSRK
ncbi:MAG: molybdopterin-synthase adenylyltransferase MoeB [Gammaproteobacteria bacterium]|nr:molybdopterin-synthase adenylyltransferase MoeB [Gammaproteobacteria bacterium]